MGLSNFNIIIFAIISFIICQQAKSEYYTAISEMEKLISTEREIVGTLEKYLKAEEERLDKMKWLSNQYSKIHNLANKDTELFLANPVNAYLLVKRLTRDWEEAYKLIHSYENRAFIYNVSSYVSLPGADDLSGAARGLLRLQEIYLLDTESIASGKITGIPKSTELTAGDCYELGKQAYKAQLYNHTIAWVVEAWRRYEKELSPTVDETQMIESLEYAAYSSFLLHNFSAAVDFTEKVLTVDPNHTRAVGNAEAYRLHLAVVESNAEEREKIKKRQSTEIADIPLEEWPDNILHPSIFSAYEKLCRGESLKTSKQQTKLKCHYTTNQNKYLLLQPVKVEVLNLSPRIVMFYDVLNDKYINLLKNLSIPTLSRATVKNRDGGENDYADYRISKSTWLYDYFGDDIKYINRRVEDISGLDTTLAEPVHVINYGIAGHYEPHIDYAEKGDTFSFMESAGNRIATLIFYLSDVIAGGSTVFPQLGVEVKPIKGAAVFWYNLLKNGEGNKKTQHAACPVLAGSKWVANKWLHEKGNEFRRPCGLNPLN